MAPFQQKRIQILLGAWRLTSDYHLPSEGIRWRRADWVHVYEGKEGFHNDIAILSMEETVEFGPKIRPICLPDDDIQV